MHVVSSDIFTKAERNFDHMKGKDLASMSHKEVVDPYHMQKES